MAAARKKTAPKKAARKALSGRAKRTSKASGAGGGRPRIEFPPEALETLGLLGMMGNTVADAAQIMGVSKRTLEGRIAVEGDVREAWIGGKANFRNALRVAQYQLGMAGNATMLIFLGKQELGQRDPPRAIEVTGLGGGPLEVDADMSGHLEELIGKFIRNREGGKSGGRKRARKR